MRNLVFGPFDVHGLPLIPELQSKHALYTALNDEATEFGEERLGPRHVGDACAGCAVLIRLEGAVLIDKIVN